MTIKKIFNKYFFILLFLCSCASNIKNDDEKDIFVDLQQLYEHRITKHLRLSFNDYLKAEDKFKIPRIVGAVRPDQLELFKEKFVVVDIIEHNPFEGDDDKDLSDSFKAYLARSYYNAYVVILISPDKMIAWGLDIIDGTIDGYKIDKIHELHLSKERKKELEIFRSSENMKYWL